ATHENYNAGKETVTTSVEKETEAPKVNSASTFNMALHGVRDEVLQGQLEHNSFILEPVAKAISDGVALEVEHIPYKNVPETPTLVVASDDANEVTKYRMRNLMKRSKQNFD
ncbi:hypothetical protein L195_g050620, partial [Trifolium pratense]